MIRQSVLYLIAEAPAAHGIFDKPEETKRMVYCTVRSVGYNEFYRALENDLHPTLVFTLSDLAEYNGEKIVEYESRRYRVVRVYLDGTIVELTVEEATVDA